MSEIITSNNLDTVITINHKIKNDILHKAMQFKASPSLMKNISMPQLSIMILQTYGLIQIPIEDNYWSGAIFIKEGKIIPVINTALPRANQIYTAWHEIYYLFYDQPIIDHIIETDQLLEERKAEYFAACMLLDGVENYFNELPEMDFISKIFYCMSMFQVPYKAVLISLYEYAYQSNNEKLCSQIKYVFDLQFNDLSNRFKELGLDDSLVKPSFVLNVAILKGKIKEKEKSNPELKYHKENERFLDNVIAEMNLLHGGSNNEY